MKKIFLSAAGLLALLSSFSQGSTADSSVYKSRKLKTEEVNLVSSYYTQDGNNAAVTGGTGSQKLTDIANIINVKLLRYDSRLRKHTFNIEMGLDHYTSASSDMIDLKANSSASHADNRFYPSLSWTMENEVKGKSVGAGISYSTEYDYQSLGFNINLSKKTNDHNGELSAKLQAYADQVTLVTPVELRTLTNGREDHYGTSPRNTYAGSLSYSQIINPRLQVMLLVDVIQQQGFLSLPFYRVYFKDASVHQEKLPDKRLKFPLGLRANYFTGDKIIIRTYYRFYTDDWGLTAHTADIEVPLKITPFLSLSPFYRFYAQSQVKYFAAYKDHSAGDTYYTSNYDLSKFNSHFFGAGIRIAPPEGIFGMAHFSMLELRYGHYSKNIDMNSDIVSLNLKFK